MATVSQELFELLEDAKVQLEAANDAVVFHEVAAKQAEEAEEFEDDVLVDAFEALQESNAVAAIALDELRKFVGV